MQRFVWDLMYPNPPSDRYDLPISAVYKDTPFSPEGPSVFPGKYTVKLTVNGKSFSKTLEVRMDPRVTTSAVGLRQQYDLSMRSYDGAVAAYTAAGNVRKVSEQLTALRQKAGADSPIAKEIADLQQKLAPLGGGGGRRGPGGGGGASGGEVSFGQLAGTFTSLLGLLQEADVTPSTQAVAAVNATQATFEKSQAAWKAILATDLPSLNSKLKASGLGSVVF